MLNREGNQLGAVEPRRKVGANCLADLKLVAQIPTKVDGSVGPKIRKCYSCEGDDCSVVVIEDADVHYDDRASDLYRAAPRI